MGTLAATTVSTSPLEERQYLAAQGFDYVPVGPVMRELYKRMRTSPVSMQWLILTPDGWTAWSSVGNYRSPSCGSATAAFACAEVDGWTA
ncbi:hypothetical protein D3C81_759350 [compost metagenome]